MNDTNDTNGKPAAGRTLGLRRPAVEQSRVKQNFSHGRTKTVAVEIKRKRVPVAEPAAPAPAPAAVAPPPAAPVPAPAPAPAPKAAAPAAPAVAPVAAAPAPAPAPTPAPAPAPVAAAPAPAAKAAPKPQAAAPSGRSGQQPSSRASSGGNRSGMVLRTLTDEEKDARSRALADARLREADERHKAIEDAKRRAEEEALAEVERKAAAARKADEDARRRNDDETKRKSEETARRLEPRSAQPSLRAMQPDEEGRPRGGRTFTDKAKRPAVAVPAPPQKVKTEVDRRRGRLTVSNALNDDGEKNRSLAAFRRRTERQKKQAQGFQMPQEKIAREVMIPDAITIQELANRMAERAVDVIKMLMRQGQMFKINDIIDADTAQLIAEEMGHKVKRVSESEVEERLTAAREVDSDAVTPRAPVVTIMGHVDHGKTSLLDAIRKTNVVSGEAGGITQHIGAYQVATKSGLVTFIDTPGHEAFTSMRARGAKVTDIVVLVVAADDGVMPQTIEAIAHAKSAGVPIIVAINKIDKPSANPTRVRTDLLSHDIVVESMGGEVLDVEVSAMKGTNLDKLLETILLQAEVLNLRAEPSRPASGIVIEAQLDKGRGPVATVLVQRGTLKIGDIFVAGSAWGRVRALVNDKSQQVPAAGPSVPAEVLGLSSAPEAGDSFDVVESEAKAREIVDYRERKRRETRGAPAGRTSLEQMMTQLKQGQRKEVPILIKADVQGSAEAIVQALDKMATDEVMARVVHYAVGGISESDISLAQASGALVLGFNVRANQQARDAAERSGIDIRYYAIIYDLVDDVKQVMSGMLAPERRETFLGNARIQEVFNITKVGKVAGCMVTEGTVQRGAKVRLIRDNVVVHEGTLSTLKRFKDEVKEVPTGQECGMAFEKYEDMRAGDVIECFRVEQIKRSL